MKATCGHEEYGENDHCAVMTCPRYINKCPVHSLAPGLGICSNDRTN